MAEDFLNLGGSGSVGAGTDAGGLVFNLNDVEEPKGFELLPKGNYPAIVDELEFGESSTGNPMFTVKFKVTEGEFAGQSVWDYWVVDGKGAEFGLGKLKKFLSRIMPEVDLSAFAPQAFADSGEAIGREVTIAVKITTQKKGEYKGEKRNQIADILTATDGSFL